MKLYREILITIISIVIASGAMANEQSLIQFKPQGTLDVSRSETSQGIAGKYLIDIDPGIIYQSSRVKPQLEDQVKATEYLNDFQLLPSGENLVFKDSIRLKSERYGQYVEGVDTYSGSVIDDETGSFTLSVSNYQVTGQVQIGQMLLNLRFDKAAKSHVLSVVDTLLMPKDMNEPDYSLENIDSLVANNRTSVTEVSTGGTASTMSSSNNGNIRILVYYTQKVANRNNVSTLSANIISELNTSLDLSEVDPDIDFILAGTKKLIDSDSDVANLNGLCKDEIKEHVVDRVSPFQNLNSNLSSYSADVALIIATEESTTDSDYAKCNVYASPNWYLQRIGGIVGAIFDSTEPFAITMDTYALGDLTALHELGHVLGGNHEIELEEWCLANLGESCFETGDGAPAYSRGYVNSSETWQTIMGGYWGCDFVALPSQPTCVRLNRWSNPVLSYSGENTGVTNESDMESALEVTAPIVADWTSYPTATPTIAPTLTVVPEHCFGSNTLAWTTISGATHYQLFSSSTITFTGSDRIYIGSNTGLFVNVAYNSTEYFRVRACNGNGCGPYSSIKSASYFNGCL